MPQIVAQLCQNPEFARKTPLGKEAPEVRCERAWASVTLPRTPTGFGPPYPSAMATQAADATLTRSATFMVLSLSKKPGVERTVRRALAKLGEISKSVGARDPHAQLSCVAGIGSDAWDRIMRCPKPSELRPFPELRGAKHTAVSTPGDLLFHIRSDRRDLCFEFERQLVDMLGSTVNLEDYTAGFRYFDARDLLGFVDGTANPIGTAASDAITITASEDPVAAGGSYAVVQKYRHDLQAWRSLSTQQQEAIIGRTKLDNVELEDALEGQQQSHKSLTTLQDASGNEQEIVRANMPFGAPGSGEYGTFFVGYSKRLWVMEKMMERMFIGMPAGKHDRILDFSRPVTGSTFFIPSRGALERLEAD